MARPTVLRGPHGVLAWVALGVLLATPQASVIAGAKHWNASNSTQSVSIPCRAPELGPSRTLIPAFVRQLIPSMKRTPRNATLTCYPYFSLAPPSKVVPPTGPRISLPYIAMLFVLVITALLSFVVWHFGKSAPTYDRPEVVYEAPPELGPEGSTVRTDPGTNLDAVRVVVDGAGSSSDTPCEIGEACGH